MTPILLHRYKNGNTTAEIYSDGTRIIEWPDGEVKTPTWPYNMDVKITNWCNNPFCVKYCYEGSNKAGKAADLSDLSVFDGLPPGVEIALGGGDTFSHPDFESFVENLSQKGLIVNATVNQYHLNVHKDKIQRLMGRDSSRKNLYGLGVSVINFKTVFDEWIFKDFDGTNQIEIVFHVIAGVHSVDEVKEFISRIQLQYPGFVVKILVLGYKTFGFGVKYGDNNKKDIEDKLFWWKVKIHELFPKCVICFDNLALEQLNPQRFFPEWELYYQGNDADGNLYLDLVERTFAKNSRSSERFQLDKGRNLCYCLEVLK